MTSKLILSLLVVLLCSMGCSTMAVDSPLCLERDFVLQPVSVEDQLLMKEASPTGFEQLALNDLSLKSYIREVEAVISAHDEPLGGCD